MEDHNGKVFVTSDSNGTTFTLYFPIVEVVNSDSSELISEPIPLGGKESILVIDDMEDVRIIAKEILEMLGYDVYTVESGEAAVEYLKDHKVDLLILDMIMDPGMNGYETYKEILKEHPSQKAIITSGYSETEDMKKTLSLGANCYLKKPYTVKALGDAVKKALSS
jgi:CheY-like chemotaxis protein